MEFPDFGKQCANKDCKQLDFLPVKCNNCHALFCKDHSRFDNHQCVPIECTNDLGPKLETTWFKCTFDSCMSKNPCEMLCPKCDKHYCLAHRHHGCLDELPGKEARKVLREAAKKSKDQFAIAKEEADKKIEASLRQAELQPEKRRMAQQIRLMKLKGKALGDNKIPVIDRVYFTIHPPIKDNKVTSAVPLFTSKTWTVGRTIDLFAVRLKIENRNDKSNAPKLRLFKLEDGEHLSNQMDSVIGRMVTDGLIFNGDSLILHYVDATRNPVEIEPEKLVEYKLSSV
ncbi:AN1-type zinc finger protein 1-like [Myzus persicae]|uniref:AN1-type zinc finger protein 1-like n=1 Tax=Myzus persicae TaxID=13164 RepID=UPI000B9318C5|nr:AN1-type zinc finger protein 1-like [Myzus persicae]XP_022160549.1 AN1-type zinc finger protein 1-like [Myzus persicae]